jgi:hypothetical protein
LVPELTTHRLTNINNNGQPAGPGETMKFSCGVNGEVIISLSVVLPRFIRAADEKIDRVVFGGAAGNRVPLFIQP